MYCVKCKTKTEIQNLQHAVSKNNRKMMRGICSVCGLRKTQFIAMDTIAGAECATTKGVDLTNSINKFTSKIKLPWAKFPGEMHLPGMNFVVQVLTWMKGSLLQMLIKIGANLWTG